MAIDREHITYRDGTRTDYLLGSVNVHTFEKTLGVEKIIAPEQSIFLIESDVTVHDVLAGLRVPEKTYRAGDVLLLPAGVEVSTLYTSRPYSETMVRIPQSTFLESTRELEHDVNNLRYTTVKDPQVFGITHLIRTLALSPDPSPVLADALTTALSVAVVHGISERAQRIIAHLPNGLSRERLRRALEFIDANLSKPMRVAQIAGAAALSTYHFTRSFKASMSVSPVQYVLQKRIELAQRMLVTTHLPLSAVALAAGFSSQNHFATAFKQITGLTAAAYRRAAA